MSRPPPISTLFPYTPFFRSRVRTDRETIEVPTRHEEVSVERVPVEGEASEAEIGDEEVVVPVTEEDRKSTRLNSSHANISYAVFCLKKKKKADWDNPVLEYL